jgi:HSP20 family protein
MLSIWREFDHPFFTFDRHVGDLLDKAATSSTRWPAITVTEQGDTFELVAEAPGLEEKDFEISVEGDVVRVSGERKVAAPEGYAPRVRERAEAKFSREFTLPTRIDADGVQATLANGVLRVVLPKAKESRARTITVKAS